MSARLVQLGLVEMREELLAHDRQVGAARCLQALAADAREARVGAARVVFAGAALEQPVALEAVDHARQAAARELRLLGEVAHPHASPGRLARGG